MRKHYQIILALALCLSMGLHWSFLQTVAWGGMLIEYSKGASIGDAIEKTLDGKHPCKLCKFVREGREAGQETDDVPVGKKLDFVVPTVPSKHLVNPEPEVLATGLVQAYSIRTESPAVPPPRLV